MRTIVAALMVLLLCDAARADAPPTRLILRYADSAAAATTQSAQLNRVDRSVGAGRPH
jgi:hypothetical protein